MPSAPQPAATMTRAGARARRTKREAGGGGARLGGPPPPGPRRGGGLLAWGSSGRGTFARGMPTHAPAPTAARASVHVSFLKPRRPRRRESVVRGLPWNLDLDLCSGNVAGMSEAVSLFQMDAVE